MHGNAWEWCSDWYGEDYYAHSPVDDPKGPATGDRRVRRGGAWNSFPLWARSAFRNWNTARSRCVNLGFRVVREMREISAKTWRGGQVTLVFGGDVMLDGGPGHELVHGTDPFADFAKILHEADISVCNLECVLAPGGQQVLKPYTFRGPVMAVPVLEKYFTAVSVANNHTGDFGPDAFSQQLTMFADAGLFWFGGGRNRQEARRPLILERNGLRIALLGYNGFPPRSFAAGKDSPGVAWLNEDEMLADIRAPAEKRPCRRDRSRSCTGARRWRPKPSDWQREMAHHLIDAGCTAVVGAHPHVTQPIEIYHGRPIVYSLGNFVFDYYPVDPPVWTGWLVRLNVMPDRWTRIERFVFQIDKAGIPHLTRSTPTIVSPKENP